MFEPTKPARATATTFTAIELGRSPVIASVSRHLLAQGVHQQVMQVFVEQTAAARILFKVALSCLFNTESIRRSDVQVT